MDIIAAFYPPESPNIKLKLLEKVFHEFSHNSSFYSDALRFNVTNGFKPCKAVNRVSYSDPPKKVRAQMARLYRTLGNEAHVFSKLNIPRETVQWSPLESMWAFRYYKKYGSEYNSLYEVHDWEITSPLTESERIEFSSLF